MASEAGKAAAGGVKEKPAMQLPTDVMSDILLRLPVRDLCRARCANKEWNEIVSSPLFVKQFLVRGCRAPSTLGLTTCAGMKPVVGFDMESTRWLQVPTFFHHPDRPDEIVSQAKGLYAHLVYPAEVMKPFDLVVSNPVTQASKWLPPRLNRSCYYNYPALFHLIAEEGPSGYKLIFMAMPTWPFFREAPTIEMEIYDSRRGSWSNHSMPVSIGGHWCIFKCSIVHLRQHIYLVFLRRTLAGKVTTLFSFNLEDNSWSMVMELPRGDSGPASDEYFNKPVLLACDDKLLVMLVNHKVVDAKLYVVDVDRKRLEFEMAIPVEFAGGIYISNEYYSPLRTFRHGGHGHHFTLFIPDGSNSVLATYDLWTKQWKKWSAAPILYHFATHMWSVDPDTVPYLLPLDFGFKSVH